jgi:two-component system cell cycle response regulator
MSLRDFFRKKALSACLDLVKEPIAVFDEKGLLEVNASMAGLLREEKSLLKKKPLKELEVFEPLQDCIRQSLQGGGECAGEVHVDGLIFKATVYPLQAEGGEELAEVVLQDVTNFVSLEEELVNRNRLLMAINSISTAFITTDAISSVFERLIEKVTLITDLDICWIAVKGEKGFGIRGTSGISSEFKGKLESGGLDEYHAEVLRSGEPFFVLEDQETEKFPDISKEGIRFIVGQPLMLGPDKAGVLAVGRRGAVRMGFDLASLLHLIGNHVSLILEKVRLYEEAEYLAVTDALTGLFNVRYFYDALSLELARAKRYVYSFSISLLDIDDFKSINDTYGHQAGDEVLRGIAGAMKRVSRESDIVARYGGEEFILILSNTGKDEAIKQAERVKNAVETEGYLENKYVKISLSGGIATFPGDGTDEKSLLHAADMALYEAKSLGKKQIRAAGG